MNEQASALLGRLGLHIDPRTPVSQLRVGQQQIVEIAKGISCDARVLIMDEPTSAFSDQEIEVLFDIVEGLKQDGVALLYITHKLEELSRIADRYTVLRDGERVDSGLIRDTATDDLIRLMVGREINSAGRPPAADPNGTEVFRVEALTLEHPSRRGDPVVKDIGFHVDRGEIVGIFGLMGAGRTELFETICGLHPSCGSGEIRVDGSRVEIRSPRDAIACGIAWAPEDRKREGLVLDMSVAENTTLACLEEVERYGFLHTSRLDSATPDAGMSYELDSIAAVVIGGTSLSGGRGSILGTVLGCLIIGVLNNGLALLQVSPFWQLVVKGCVILAAVAVDRTQSASE